MPVLILVMTTMMDGTVSVDPNTGVETTVEAFKKRLADHRNRQRGRRGDGYEHEGMCNINLVYFMTAVFLCIFVADDFRSGYAKNLFTVRAKRSDYVISKTLIGFVGGVFLLLAFFAGAMLGGAISGLPSTPDLQG